MTPLTTAAPLLLRRRSPVLPGDRLRAAGGVLLVLSGLVAQAGLWLGLAGGAWAAGWPWLAVPLGLPGALTLLLLGGALRAAGAGRYGCRATPA